MRLTEEEIQDLISEINELTNHHPLFYLKFCKEESYVQDILQGNLYANTAEYFRQLEINSGERGQGDKFETILNIETQNITVIDRATEEVVLTAPKATMTAQFEVDKIIPIVCFVGIPFEQMNIIKIDNTHVSFTLPFAEEEYNKMQEKFGKYCVIINGKELEERISNYCNFNEYDYVFGKVEYCDQNRIDRAEAFRKGSKKRFLYKNSDLSFQREYRLAVALEIPRDHYIRIGALTGATYIEAEKLRDLVFKIDYKVISK